MYRTRVRCVYCETSLSVQTTQLKTSNQCSLFFYILLKRVCKPELLNLHYADAALHMIDCGCFAVFTIFIGNISISEAVTLSQIQRSLGNRLLHFWGRLQVSHEEFDAIQIRLGAYSLIYAMESLHIASGPIDCEGRKSIYVSPTQTDLLSRSVLPAWGRGLWQVLTHRPALV